MTGDPVRKSSDRRVRWTVLGSVAALAVTVLVAIWLAFSIGDETEIEIEEPSGTILIRGGEEPFVGTITGRYQGRTVVVQGLPVADRIARNPLALRSLCTVRDDPQTDWSKAQDTLRAHLNSNEMDAICAPLV